MRIVVETLSGRSTAVEVTAASTVRGVKLRVQAALGIPHGTQMLSLDGHVLDNDDLTLADYHVGPNAQLRVAILHTSSKERDRIKELPLLQVHGPSPQPAPTVAHVLACTPPCLLVTRYHPFLDLCVCHVGLPDRNDEVFRRLCRCHAASAAHRHAGERVGRAVPQMCAPPHPLTATVCAFAAPGQRHFGGPSNSR